MSGSNGSEVRAIFFGPFRLFPAERLLLDADKPLRLGSRAFEILIALVERAGELVSKTELMARVWPATTVVEDNLTVHVAALRRAVGDGKDGNRYIITIPGRGYCFVAPVTQDWSRTQPTQPEVSSYANNLPTSLTRLIGRGDAIDRLVQRLAGQRLLGVVGPGGIGKTSVALAVAERRAAECELGLCMVDLAVVSDPRLVPSAVAAAIGLKNPSECSLPRLVAALADRQMLLILDNCEHVVAAAADLAISVLRRTASVRILATSREPLRVPGEHVYRLSTLESPLVSAALTAADALAFPAVQLFVERVAASLGGFELDDADAPLVADICRRLDGLPLAIEFAAARVGSIGVRGVADRINDRLGLLASGHRTSPPRQQSMFASFEWDYGRLGKHEQAILRRLSVLPNGFTLPAAERVASEIGHCDIETIDHIAKLVAKSLIIADIQGTEPRLRLLETTRAFARAKLAESGECGGTALPCARSVDRDRDIAVESELVVQ